MGENPPEELMYRYDAFISYSHQADSQLATLLQSRLERWARPWYRTRTAKLFRDQTSLTATPHLWTTIVQGLDQSKYLVLLASTEAAKSPWVSKEVCYWVTGGKCDNPEEMQLDQAFEDRVDRVMLVLTEGEIVWNRAERDFDWNVTTAVPPVMRKLPWEPLWIDLRWARGLSVSEIESHNGLTEATLKLLSRIRRKTPQELLDQNDKEQKHAIRLFRSLAAGIAIAFVVVALFANTIRTQRNTAIWRSQVSQAQKLAVDAQRIRNADSEIADVADNHEDALRMALQGYRLHNQVDGDVPEVIDRSLRTILDRPMFGVRLDGHWKPESAREEDVFITHCQQGVGIWEMQRFRPRLVQVIACVPEEIAISDDAAVIATTSASTVTVFQKVQQWKTPETHTHDDKITTIRFRPHSDEIIVSDERGKLLVLDRSSGLFRLIDQHHSSPIISLALSETPAYCVSVSRDSAFVRDLDFPSKFLRLKSRYGSDFGDPLTVPQIAVSNGGIAAHEGSAVSFGTIASIQDSIEQFENPIVVVHTNRRTADTSSGPIELSRDGRLLAFDLGTAIEPTVMHEFGVFQLRERSDKAWERVSLIRSSSEVWDVRFAAHDRLLLTTHGTNDSPEYLWTEAWFLEPPIHNLYPQDSLPLVDVVNVSGQKVKYLGFSGRGNRPVIAPGFFNGEPSTFISSSGEITRIALDVSCAAFSDTDPLLVAIASFNSLQIWEVPENNPLRERLRLDVTGTKAMQFVDKGRALRIAWMNRVEDINLARPVSRRDVATLPKNTTSRFEGALNATGELLATTTDSEVQIVHLPDMEVVARYNDKGDPTLTEDVQLVCFDSKSKQVAIVTSRNVSIWSLKHPQSPPISLKRNVDFTGITITFWDDDKWLLISRKFGGFYSIPTTKALFEAGTVLLGE